MSSTRALQAAQKRRAEVPGGKPSPQPSINSSQMFNQQGQGQMQGGRGQQRMPPQSQGTQGQQRQQPRQPQAQQQPSQQQSQGQEGPSKMTLPQAITLITLRLGSLETKLMNMEHSPPQHTFMEGVGGSEAVNLEPILSRLEFLEQRKETPSASVSTSASQTQTHEIASLKTQMEALKQFVVKNKATAPVATGPSVNELNALKKDILELKDSIKSLQQMSIENTNKLMEMELSLNSMNSSGLNNNGLNCGSDEFNNDRYSSYIGMNTNDNVDEMMNAMFRSIGSTMTSTIYDDNRNILDEEDTDTRGIEVEELGDDDNLNGTIHTID